ncbi:MAG: DUF2156 domain-containing protein [Desulfobacterales bacterium]|nr:DUF2156 domain-containing protein [Desulfobacterales bacterium]
MIIIEFPEFNRFDIKDKKLIRQFADRFNPLSCEYNFSNLFCWQDSGKLSFTLYKGRLLIYDGIEQSMFMPLGEKFSVKELVKLSSDMKNIGMKSDFSLVTEEYIKEFPEIENSYIIKKKQDYAEYIYNVDSLCDLKGKKLSKKRNLISQFKRSYPDFEIHLLKNELKKESLWLAEKLLSQQKKQTNTINQELEALKVSLDCFEEIGFEGLVVVVDGKVIAFSVFSQFKDLVYDIHFEKADINFKGAAQVINQETAKYLKGKCQYLNKEQDLGIKGLRQAKMSYEPEIMFVPYGLTFCDR